MSEWRRHWHIAYRWRREVAAGRQVNSIVDSPAKVRACVEWARTNPDVERWTVTPQWHMVGEKPQKCGNGHPYKGVAFGPQYGWRTCGCGGHMLYLCRTAGCDDVTVDPPVGPGCEPEEPAPGETIGR